MTVYYLLFIGSISIVCIMLFTIVIWDYYLCWWMCMMMNRNFKVSKEASSAAVVCLYWVYVMWLSHTHTFRAWCDRFKSRISWRWSGFHQSRFELEWLNNPLILFIFIFIYSRCKICNWKFVILLNDVLHTSHIQIKMDSICSATMLDLFFSLGEGG